MRVSTSALAGAGLFSILTFCAGSSEAAEDPHVQRGRTFVQTHCARCNAVSRTGESPRAEAPRFRDLHTRNPVTDLAEALSEGIRTGHPGMPEFQPRPYCRSRLFPAVGDRSS
jgi:hypothetical protein